MSDYALDLISTLGARADAGELVPFGWGGPLAGWTRRLRNSIESEGYGDGGPGGWISHASLIAAELPAAPADCTCEGCQERLTPEQRLSRELGAKIAQAIAGAAGWKHCAKCYAMSRRAAEWRDGLCFACAGKQ